MVINLQHLTEVRFRVNEVKKLYVKIEFCFKTELSAETMPVFKFGLFMFHVDKKSSHLNRISLCILS